MKNYNVKSIVLAFFVLLMFGFSQISVSSEINAVEKQISVRAIQPITYVLNGGTNSTSNPTSYTGGIGVASFHPATKTMNSFVGWFDAAGNQVTSIPTTLDAPVTLYAAWSPIGTPEQYTVTYDVNGGVGSVVEVNTFLSGEVAVVKDATGVTKPGQMFVGWNSAIDGSGTSFAPNSSITVRFDITLYAMWAPATYNITYNLTGGVGSIVDPNTYVSGQTATVQNITGASKPGFEFVEWNSAIDGTGLSYLPGSFFSVTSNTTLYAIWNPVAVPVTITYDASTGIGSVVDPNVYAVGSEVVVKSSVGISKPGYTFVGWNTLADGTGISYEPNSTIILVGNTVLYAQWKAISPVLPQTGSTYNIYSMLILVSLGMISIYKRKF